MQIREHGIYRRRDGLIVGPIRRSGDGIFRWTDGSGTWTDDGRYLCNRSRRKEGLVKEIVVGNGWFPWNGGTNPVAGRLVEVIYLNGSKLSEPYPSEGLKWTDAIVAYRPIDPPPKFIERLDDAEPSVICSIDTLTIKSLMSGGYLAARPGESWTDGTAFTSRQDLFEWLRVNLK